ncbi:S-adenosyl-L-methionine-dependent methyltransferase [Mycena maculata]|uniref:S-adenosyl-L-methionine-dependent methyltransferase n=1 Tax=Mycena maculata TaxID=230809 RepID=A0AAD7I9Y4_9AGAR|nr:S-adenosyl-L-methionine-dependent methyltransferase [Mycena maculata]
MQQSISHSAYATLPAPRVSSTIAAPGFVQRKIAAYARTVVLAALQRGIKHGQLELIEPSGAAHYFGDWPAAAAMSDKSSSSFKSGQDDPHGAPILRILDDKFWLRVYRSYDVGFSEAYMSSEIDSPDLKAVLDLFISNLQEIDRQGGTTLYRALNVVSKIKYLFSHGHTKAIANVAIYDASNELYHAFLSEEMQYSCPIWSPDGSDGGVRGDLEGHRAPGDLEAAQARKIAYVLRKSRIQPGGRLLEIGSGWGGLSIAAAHMGCTVDTITLSVEQKAMAEARIAAAGFAGQIRVHLMDYRDMPADWEHAFDACISIEMLEAVGPKYMPTYLSKIDWALKAQNSAAVLTATTYSESNFTRYQSENFIRKYHWRRAVIPSAFSLAQEVQNTLKGRFCIDTIEDFATHYPRCLREWGRRLDESWTPELIASLQRRYPELNDPHALEMFRRKWHYMYVYMEVAFSRAWLGCITWTFARPGFAAQRCA